MNTIRFNDYDAFAMRMVNDVMNGKWTAAVLFFDDAAELVKAIIRTEKDIDIYDIDLNSEMVMGYNREYLVSINEDFVLAVNPLWHEDNEYHKAGYLGFDADVCYVDGDAHNAAIWCVDRDACYEVFIDGKIESDFDCEECEFRYSNIDYVLPLNSRLENLMRDFNEPPNNISIKFTGYI